MEEREAGAGDLEVHSVAVVLAREEQVAALGRVLDLDPVGGDEGAVQADVGVACGAGGVDRVVQGRCAGGEDPPTGRCKAVVLGRALEAASCLMRVPSMKNRSVQTAWDHGVRWRVPLRVPMTRR